ncbi:uncharacterized protein LOC118179363 [Stegodyphus dumicola]|uniref:uncharacterized protein LOC118179363 n=1 Tax=Stegodyphus dumicola TaxID=202533 RepID=UPI0015AF85B8|nr:uncharacterized protein LOC118179363 [Stegodyphus dumicola]
MATKSEERDFGTTSKSGPRSRSAEPGMNHNQQKLIMIQSFPPISSGCVSVLPKTDEFPNITEPSCETTEYKSQFAWPRKPQTDVPCMARKSVSMGVIKGSEETDASVPKSKLAPIHRPCVKQKEVKNLEKTVQEVKKKPGEYFWNLKYRIAY